jgi:hypothetical protein
MMVLYNLKGEYGGKWEYHVKGVIGTLTGILQSMGILLLS